MLVSYSSTRENSNMAFKTSLILVMVTVVMTPSVSYSAQPTIDSMFIVDFMNRARINVETPPASNIRLMVS